MPSLHSFHTRGLACPACTPCSDVLVCVQVWELDTQHCSQTLGGGGSTAQGGGAEIWSLDVDHEGRRVVTGGQRSGPWCSGQVFGAETLGLRSVHWMGKSGHWCSDLVFLMCIDEILGVEI